MKMQDIKVLNHKRKYSEFTNALLDTAWRYLHYLVYAQHSGCFTSKRARAKPISKEPRIFC